MESTKYMVSGRCRVWHPDREVAYRMTMEEEKKLSERGCVINAIDLDDRANDYTFVIRYSRQSDAKAA